MQLAIISDIHANLPALEKVWKHLQQQQPDSVFCLGDLVNFAGWDNEVIEFIRSKNIITLQGNHDEGIGYGKSFRYSYKTEAQKQFGVASIERLKKIITEENKKFLRALPFSLLLTFKFPYQTLRLALVHGSPFGNEDYVQADTSDEDLLMMLDDMKADVLLMGHTHKPFHKAIYNEEENRKQYRHAVNVGSVGKPKHGNNKACYTIVDIDESISMSDPASVNVAFHFIPYDVNSVLEKIHRSGLGNAYDDFLINGES